MSVDLFLDFSKARPSDIPDLLSQVESWTGFGPLHPAVTSVLPHTAPLPSFRGEVAIARPEAAVQAAARAAEAAGATGRALLCVFGSFVPSIDSAGALLEALHQDPLFGFAIPRMATEDGSGIELFPHIQSDGPNPSLARRGICDLPAFYIVPEMIAPCVLVRNCLLANRSLRPSGFKTAAGALLHFLSKARRIGFRGAICNRIVVPWCDASMRTETLEHEDLWELLRLAPDTSRARLELERAPFHHREMFLARAHSPAPRMKRSLLLDATAMGPRFDGTSECFLGIADGLHNLRHDWSVTIAAQPDAAEFHLLRKRFHKWAITDGMSAKRHTVAFRPSQPWAFQTMRSLHEQALLNYYLVLDTIAWDTLTAGPENIEEVWRFLAHYADGLLYISEFSGQRFRMRFPAHPAVQEETLYLSFNSHDYVRRGARRRSGSEPGYVLIVGNSYDHKDLVIVTETLASCFPFQRFRVVGLREASEPNIEAISSGAITQSEMERLYANAQVVVFPSFYEGFGFPVIRGLSYGRPVVARRSALLDELAAHFKGDGSLFAYSTYLELADTMSALLRGEHIQAVQLGSAVDQASGPLDWAAIAAQMLTMLEKRLIDPGQGRWSDRENAFRQIAAFNR